MLLRTLTLVCVLSACDSRAEKVPRASDPLFRGLAAPEKMTFDSNDPYAGFGYSILMQSGMGRFGPLPPQFRACHKAPVDTLQFEFITLELRGDSLRGFLQDKQEGNLLAPYALLAMSYDTVARVLRFDAPTAPRTLLSFDVSPSCDSLVGIYRVHTAYHPQDRTSGVSSAEARLRRGPQR